MQRSELEALKVEQLRKMHMDLKLPYSGLKKAELVSNLLANASAQPQTKKVRAEAEGASAAEAASPASIEQSESVLAVVRFAHRYIVIVKGPETEIDSLPGVSDYNTPFLSLPGPPRPCKNMAFELSTGTSNVYNFPGVFLPILRVDANSWLHKDQGLGGHQPSFIRDRREHSIPVAVLYNYVLSKLHVEGHDEECMKRAIIFLDQFIDRFGTWKQLQVSASFGGILWDNYKVTRYLREFVLTYNFMPRVSDPSPETQAIIKSLLSKATIPEAEYKKPVMMGDRIVEAWPEYLKWAAGPNALKQSSYRVDTRYRFYYSPHIIKRRVFDPSTAIQAETPDVVNKILKEYDALCELKDNTPHSLEKTKENEQRKERAIRGDVRYDPVSRGWKDCGQMS
jgi:hypothetical protein